MKKKYRFEGSDVLGEEVEFEPERELFNTYILEDGTKLRFKAVVSRITRLETYKEDGEPVYMVQSSNIVVTNVPESLKNPKK